MLKVSRMRYSVDFRMRAVELAHEQKNKSKVCRLLRIGRNTLDRWLSLDDLTPKKPGPTKPWKLDPAMLKAHVEEIPDAYQSERAEALHVSPNTIGYGLRRLKISRKKNDALPRAK